MTSWSTILVIESDYYFLTKTITIMLRANIRNRAFDRMGEHFAHLIDPYHFLGRSAFDVPYESEKRIPAANIRQDDTLFVLELAIPGFRKEEIEIVVKDNILTVRGEKSKSEVATEPSYILEEFNFRSFERSFRLSPQIGQEKVTARYEDGILKIMFTDVPKEEERSYRKVNVE